MQRLWDLALQELPVRESIASEQLEGAWRAAPILSGQGSDMWKVQHRTALADEAKQELEELLTSCEQRLAWSHQWLHVWWE
eukprot:6931189-Pyramimonas_sp.AAC.1